MYLSNSKVRKAFHRLQIFGRIDKCILASPKDAIDRELSCKIPPLLSAGGYIPDGDHAVPPEASWENSSYYRKRITELVGSTPVQV